MGREESHAPHGGEPVGWSVCVWEEVSMFLVELTKDKVTVNVIMGATTMGALTVTSFAGEGEDVLRVTRRACTVI